MRTLRVSLPGSADMAQIVAAVRSLVAVVGRPHRLFSPRRFLCLELWATITGIAHLVTSPDRAGSIAALSAALPGARIEEFERPIERLPGTAVGLKVSGPAEGILRTDISSEAAHALLAGMSNLHDGEAVAVQWLVAPLQRTRMPFAPSEELDRVQRAKRSETEVVATGRIGVWAGHQDRARKLAANVAHVLRLAGGADGHLRVRSSRRAADDLVRMRLPSMVWPSHLNVGELASLIGWPTSPTPIPGVARGVSRLLPPPAGLPNRGPIVGVTTAPGSVASIRLGDKGRLRHLHVIGPTGVGKSTLLTHLIATDVRDGRGVVAFDPLGDLTEALCEQIPKDRLDDVVVVDPTETERPVGTNVLHGGDRHRNADFIVGVMSRLFASSWGPRTADILRASVLTLSTTKDSTLADLPDLLTNQSFRRRHIAKVMDDRVLAGFWTWFDNLSDAERTSAIAPVLNKIRAVALRPEALRTLCHPDGRLDLSEVFTRRKVVIVRMAKGLVGQDTASLIGGLLLAKLWQNVLARAAIDPSRRHPVFVYLDEFQDYLRLPIGIGDMLAQARGMGVGLVVAHQHLGQLPDSVKRDVLSNIGSRVIFQTTADDSRLLARDLEPHLDASDLRGLASREIVARIAIPDRILPPVTGRTLPPTKPTSDAEQVREASRERFGRPIPSTKPATDTTGPVGRKRRGGQQ